MISLGEIKVIVLNGRGTFSGGQVDIISNFKLHRQLVRSVVVIEDIDPPFWIQCVDYFALEGILDDGRAISVIKLQPIQSCDSNRLIELVPFNCSVSIGSSSVSHPIEARYSLFGLFEGSFKIEFDDWKVELVADANAPRLKKLSESLKLPLEGLDLKISGIKKSEEEYESIAQDIMLLLSLAIGNGVSSSRWLLAYPNHDLHEQWCSRSGLEIGPGCIVHNWNLAKFLQQCFPVLRGMSQEDRDLIKVAVVYLNISATGYLDTRLIQIAQAWEFLAAKWAPKGNLTEQENNLRETIKNCCRNWRKDHPPLDSDGSLGKRILFAFEWPKLKRQIEALADQACLDLEKVGINLQKLKAARDAVAHQGRLEVLDPSVIPYHELLTNAQFGLQLLLLTKLGYTGHVEVSENGYCDHKLISYFLNRSGHE
jgi:hypothetical protein